MMITSIEVRGESGNIGVFSRLIDRDGLMSPTISIEILSEADEPKEIEFEAADKTALWQAAKRAQRLLDGYKGAGGDVREYSTLLEQMGD